MSEAELQQVSGDRLGAHHPSELPHPLASLLPPDPDPTPDVADLLFDVFPARYLLIGIVSTSLEC